MPGVLLGVKITPMDGAEEVLHPERPNVNKPKVRRAMEPKNNRADVRRFIMPPDTREFRLSPDLVTEASSFDELVTTSY